MHKIRREVLAACVAALLAAATLTPGAAEARESFNDEYVFATTRSVSEMDMNPALKVTLIPATVILDTVFLPFAVVAGFFT